MKYYKIWIVILIGLWFLACEKKEHMVHWDRDMCERCKMVVSDRKNSVRMQLFQSKKYYVFDDIGCYVWWLREDKRNKELEDGAQVVINDSQTGEWIAIKSALYTADNITPMGYGFWAYKQGTQPAGKKILTFKEVEKMIIAKGR